MDPGEQARLREILRDRRDAVAGEWYRAVHRTSFAPLSAPQVRQWMQALTAETIDVFLAEPFEHEPAVAIGQALAQLHLLQPEALGRTQELLARRLTEGLPAQQVAALQPRLAALLGDVAAGFLQVARATILSEQEQVLRAATSELRRVQDRLRSQHSFLSAVFDTAAALIVAVDRAGRIVLLNRATTDLIGYAVEEVRGMRLWEVFTVPERVPGAIEFFRQVQANELRTHEFPREVQGPVRTRSGGVRLVDWRYTAIPDDHGQIEYLIGAGIDVTEQSRVEQALRESEVRFRTIFESAPIGIAITDQDGTLLRANRALEEMLGYQAGALQGASFADVTHPDDVAENRRLYRELADGHSDHFRMEKRYTRKDGHVVWADVAVSGIRGADGRLQHVFSMIEDITERKRAEVQLREAERMTSMGLMAGGIAHELRNPLGIIASNAQLLVEHARKPAVSAQCARNITLATRRAADIIDNLLRYARPEEDALAATDLQAVLEDSLPLVTHRLDAGGISLQWELDSDLPEVYGSPGLLRQVFTNLILNACNAMPQGGVLTVAGGVAAAGEVELRFIDNGRGIPPEDLGRIFDPFFTTMPVGQGTGLGLAVTRSIVQMHRGTITVASEVGQGTAVTVRLPAIGNSPPAGQTIG